MKTKRTRSSFRSMSSKIHTLANEKDVFLLTHTIPHSLRFPHCDAVMHHGGAGTTHSVARTGKPQVIMPLIIDQPYWTYRVQQLKIGPERIFSPNSPAFFLYTGLATKSYIFSFNSLSESLPILIRSGPIYRQFL